MSKFTLASRPATISIATSPESGTTIGRFERSCGAIGTTTQPAMPGCRIGPPAESAYAVEPVGEPTIRPSARRLATNSPSISIFSSTMPAVAPRLTITSLRAKPSKIVAPSRSTPPSSMARCSSSYSPSSIGGERLGEPVEGDVGDEAEPALVDADQRRAVAGELAGDAEHGAVAAEHDRDVAGGAQRARRRGAGQPVMPVLRAVSSSTETARPRPTRIRPIEFELFADAAGVEFADERSVPEAGRHSRDYTTATPFAAGENGPLTLCTTMLDERAKTLLKALVERYIADGQPVGSRTLSRASGLELSPATIRNVMADLEELGLIASPHTSAGRIPTARGYRLFVDTMLTAQPQRLPTSRATPRSRRTCTPTSRSA